METEIWRPVVGQEGNYEVSNIGNVRSLDRFINHPKSKTGKNYVKGRILKKIKQNHGYYCVSLKHGQKTTVHSLVAEAFIGPQRRGYHIDHINRVRTDNRVENLRYLTVVENSVHLGENHPATFLKTSDIHSMRSLFTAGVRICDIARKYGLRHSTAWLIVNKYTWKHI